VRVYMHVCACVCKYARVFIYFVYAPSTESDEHIYRNIGV